MNLLTWKKKTSHGGNFLLEKKIKEFFKNPKEGLEIKGSSLMTSRDLSSFFDNSINKGGIIKFLSLTKSPILKKDIIPIVARECPNLEHLNVSECANLKLVKTQAKQWAFLGLCKTTKSKSKKVDRVF